MFFWVSYCLFVTTEIPSKYKIFTLLLSKFPHHCSWIQTVQVHLVCWLFSLESRVYYSIYLCEFSPHISPGPDNCANPFWNEIFSDLFCQWTCLPLRFCWHWKSYQIWLMTHQSQIQLFLWILLLKVICGTLYTLKVCRKQRFYFLWGLWEEYLLPFNWAY